MAKIHRVKNADREWVRLFIRRCWGSDRMVSRGRLFYPGELDGFIASIGSKRVGLATFRVEEHECEVVTLNSKREGRGVGAELLDKVRREAQRNGSKRVWLITTNDNVRALSFFQKRGFRLAKLYPNALEESRRLKPEIPLIGMDGIPLRDEIELEILI